MVRCTVCGLLNQVKGTPGPDQWCVGTLEDARCTNCGANLQNVPAWGPKRWKWRFGGGRRRHVQQGFGCKGLDSADPQAIRRRAIPAVLLSRLPIRTKGMGPVFVHAMEDLLTMEDIDRLCTALGHPRFCPGDMPIPMGSCCKTGRLSENPAFLPLLAMRTNDKGRVLLIDMDPRGISRLEAMGLRLGISLRVISDGPVFTVQIEDSQIAMERALPGRIYVLLEPL